MFLVAYLWVFLGDNPVRILAPEGGVFAGRVQLRIEVDFPPEDVLGIEVLANSKSLIYFEEPPYEAAIDFRDLTAGHLKLKVIVTLFDGSLFEAMVEGENHPHLYEEEVNLVRIPVLTPSGGKDQGLSFTDFEVLENGIIQNLEHVLSEDQPLELLVLLDISGSMDKRLITVRRGMQRLLASLGAEDRIRIIGFNHAVFEVFPPGTDKEKALRSLNQLSAVGETNLYGAIWSGVKILSQVHLRRALVVFTDGRHELTQKVGVMRDLASCLDEAQRHGIPIYTMGCGAGIDPKVLRLLATKTGGMFFRLRGSKAIQAAFEDVGRQLRQQFLVCYQTKTSLSGWHKIEVHLKQQPEVMLRYPSRLYIRRSR